MASAKRRLAFVAAVVVGFVPLAATPAWASGCGSDTGCLSPRPGVGAVKIRVNATSSSTALGQLNAGQVIDCYGFAPCYETSIVGGQRVTACGTTSNLWWAVRYNGRKAYMSYACVASGG